MKRSEYERKLEKWEAEGYDVSELREKWFPKAKVRRRWLAVTLAIIILVGGLVELNLHIIWPVSAPTPTPELAPIPAPSPETDSCTVFTHVIPGEGGTIQASPLPNSDGKYPAGTRVTLEARPSKGFHFIRWSGDAQGTMPSIVVTMNWDKSIIAEFEKVP